MATYELLKLPSMWGLERLELSPMCGQELLAFLNRWQIREDLAHLALELGECYLRTVGSTLFIISGYRTFDEQARLILQGRPAADPSVSNHTVLPALAFDIASDPVPTKSQKQYLGQCARCIGLRWGGGSPFDEDGIPSDWAHFDLGPRSANQ